MADHFDVAANRRYAAGKAAGLNGREAVQIPAGEYEIRKWVRPEEDECFHNEDGPRAGDYQGESPVD